MPTLTAPPAFDLDAAGRRLITEVEAYLASLPAPAPASSAGPAGGLLDRILPAAPAVPRYGSVLQPWHAGIDLPTPSLLDRIRSRRPVAQVTPGEHLLLVSRYIHQYGWLQGALWDEQGRVCILGGQLAVLQAGYGTPAVVEQARLVLGNELGRQREGQPLDRWNDAPGRTAAQVHQLLQRAAARAR